MLRVVDGDTVDMKVHLGFHIDVSMKFRLSGINAPEVKTEEGKISRDYLKEFLPIDSEVVIITYKDKQEKYGRYLAIVLKGDINVNEHMVSEGYAVYQDY